MAVTKQTYTMNAGFTSTNVINALRQAFIDAGLMTDWHDSFTISGNPFRVLRIEHDNTKAYGTLFYQFQVSNNIIHVNLITNGWKTSGTAPINIPTGTQFLDYHVLPAIGNTTNGRTSTHIFSGYSTTSDFFLDRFTSGDDSKQSWFVFRQPSTLTSSFPFTILHKDTVLHSWLDLTKGCISGFHFNKTTVSNRVGLVRFTTEEMLRRVLLLGSCLRGNTETTLAETQYHRFDHTSARYQGVGSESNSVNNNVSRDAFPLPVGRNYNNPEYTTDYVPICTNLPWSIWTPTRLANDFGVYMHYAANNIALGDRFVVQSAVNEWEVLNWANNANVTDGASATFLARII